MITKFLDTETASDHDRFQAWRTEHQDGAVLMLGAGSSAVLHGVRCFHFGSGPPYFSSTDGFCSLTSRPKLCGSESELTKWAAQNGLTLKGCQHCTRDGLIGDLDVRPELERQSAEAEAVLARVLPRQKDRALVLKRLLESASIAETVGPSAWGATLFSDGFRLNVGQVEALVLAGDTLRVNLFTELGAPPAIGPRFVSTTYRSMSEPQCAFVGTIADYAEVEGTIAAAHEAFVRRAASTRSGEARVGTPFRRSHNEGLLDFARSTLGRTEAGPSTPQRTDYVAYHSLAVMGYPWMPDARGQVTFLSTKPESVVRQVLGNTVWIFSGERDRAKTHYRLRGKFRPHNVVRADNGWQISGPGTFPLEPIDVTDEDWFRELLAEQANFSLGMNRIRSANVLLALDSSLRQIAKQSSSATLPEELPEGAYREGQGVQVTVNRYERDACARAACLKHFGPLCQICRVDLSTFYGPIADGLVHVHHLRPLSQVEGEYEVRPDHDLIPICPNCHAVIHRQDPPLTPDEVRALIAEARMRIS